MSAKLGAITPGEVLQEEFLRPLGLSQNQLARGLRVTPGRVNDIIHGRRSITPDTAARLALFFGTTPGLWINLQARYDAKTAERELMPAMSKRIRLHTPSAA
jgi:addiction module HigA family antidote